MKNKTNLKSWRKEDTYSNTCFESFLLQKLIIKSLRRPSSEGEGIFFIIIFFLLFFTSMRIALKVIPLILLCWIMTSVADVGGIEVKVKNFLQ